MTAFAANSVLCRMALGADAIDASTFTVVRLATGAVVLLAILRLQRSRTDAGGSWLSALMLFGYAAAFSFAYITLDTGTGALILFGAVQITMIAVSVVRRNRLRPMEWIGALVAFGGFIYLVLPGVSAPPFAGFVLMSVAGAAWGIYTLRGRGSQNALGDTTQNFVRSLGFAGILAAAAALYASPAATRDGLLLAALSGGVTSGIGYTVWYAALTGLTATQAAVVQLSVPVIAAFGGVVFVSESISPRLVISTILILGGILGVIAGRRQHR